MKNVISFLFISLFFISSVFAQMGMKGKIDDAKEIKERKLLVVLQDDEIKGFEDFNSTLKDVIKNNWTFNSEYEFVTREELKSLRKDKKAKKKYAFLMYSSYSVVNNFPENSFRITLLDKKICTYFQMIDSDEETFNKADILFTIQRLQDIMSGLADFKKMSKSDFKNIGKKQAEMVQEIKTKTLFINKDIVDQKTRKILESKYQYNYKVVDKSQIDAAIINKEKDVVFIKAMIQARAPTVETKRNVTGVNGSGTAIKETSLVRNSSSVDAIVHSIYNAETGKALYAFNIPKSKLVLGKINSKMNYKDFQELIDALK
jgi:hypothetical protein